MGKVKTAVRCIVFWVFVGSAFFCAVPGSAFQLAMLGQEPDWSVLDRYQASMTRSEFENALTSVYLPNGYDEAYIRLYPEFVLIRTDGDDPKAYYRLQFAPEGHIKEETDKYEPVPSKDQRKPLSGLVIAIDPGHIGGDFSQMERRHFQIGREPPVKEGDLTLIVSKKLKEALEARGASAVLVRTKLEPVTDKRPEDFMEEAEALERKSWLKDQGALLPALPWQTQWFQKKVRERAEMLFYRVSEIHARARIINEQIRPDLTLAVHFNVSPWPEGNTQALSDENHMHVIVHGTCTPGELALDDVRLQIFEKLLSRNYRLEIPLSASVANALAEVTELPAFTYGGGNASNQGNNPYLWARNLLANRLYKGPVVYLEAYCTNSKPVYKRLQIGDYEGLRILGGTPRLNLFEEYVEGVVDGLVAYFLQEE